MTVVPLPPRCPECGHAIRPSDVRIRLLDGVQVHADPCYPQMLAREGRGPHPRERHLRPV